jgi:nucleotide-binding universal stress UspA family protein
MISKILVPTDGSETARKSVQYASELAKQLGATTITLLSVIDTSSLHKLPLSATVAPGNLQKTIEDYMREAAEEHANEATKICKANGIQTETAIRSGHPVEEIINEAVKSKVDLIVMGSHGRSSLKAALLGSITFGVIHKDTKIPVLVVRK